jgi:hypothetical protein
MHGFGASAFANAAAGTVFQQLSTPFFSKGTFNSNNANGHEQELVLIVSSVLSLAIGCPSFK